MKLLKPFFLTLLLLLPAETRPMELNSYKTIGISISGLCLVIISYMLYHYTKNNSSSSLPSIAPLTPQEPQSPPQKSISKTFDISGGTMFEVNDYLCLTIIHDPNAEEEILTVTAAESIVNEFEVFVSEYFLGGRKISPYLKNYCGANLKMQDNNKDNKSNHVECHAVVKNISRIEASNHAWIRTIPTSSIKTSVLELVSTRNSKMTLNLLNVEHLTVACVQNSTVLLAGNATNVIVTHLDTTAKYDVSKLAIENKLY